MKPGGISSTWWVTSTIGGDVGVGGQRRQRRHELLAAAEVEPGGGLVEQHAGPGSVISVRASSTRWRSPDDSVPNCALGQVADAERGRGGPAPGSRSSSS